MDIELQNELFNEFPSLFEDEGGKQSLFVIECGNGWFDIINALCESVSDYFEMNSEFLGFSQSEFYFSDISEKNGKLRIYVSTSNKIIDGMIRFAEHYSSYVCEITGERGAIYNKNGYYKTLSPLKARELGFL